MPSRIVREGINSSPRINQLSPLAELFYRRLMTVADDYGRYYATPVTLRCACWPLCPEKVTDKQVDSWLKECCSGGEPLITLYSHKGNSYLQMQKFGQQTRAKSKFPEMNCLPIDKQVQCNCEADDNHMIITCLSPDEPIRSRSRISESESESYSKSLSPDEKSASAEAETEHLTELEATVQQVSDEIHSRHPAYRRDCSVSVVAVRLRAILKRHCGKTPSTQKADFLWRVSREHASHCVSSDWQKEGGEYAKALSNYLAPTMDRYLSASHDKPAPQRNKYGTTTGVPAGMNPGLIS